MYLQLIFCWFVSDVCCFREPLGTINQVNQYLDSLGQPTQALILQNELLETQRVLEEKKTTWVGRITNDFTVIHIE